MIVVNDKIKKISQLELYISIVNLAIKFVCYDQTFIKEVTVIVVKRASTYGYLQVFFIFFRFLNCVYVI